MPAETIRRAQAKDPEAFAEIVHSVERLVQHVVGGVVGWRRRAQVEDLTQEVLLKIYLRLNRFDAEQASKLPSWIATLARNHCLDSLKRKRHATVSLDRSGDEDEELDLPWQGLDPHEEAVVHEQKEVLARAVDQLPEHQREVVRLREYEGLQYRRVATLVGATLGTVKSRAARAREALRVRLCDAREAAA